MVGRQKQLDAPVQYNAGGPVVEGALAGRGCQEAGRPNVHHQVKVGLHFPYNPIQDVEAIPWHDKRTNRSNRSSSSFWRPPRKTARASGKQSTRRTSSRCVPVWSIGSSKGG